MGGRHVAGGGAGPRGGESKAEREQLEQQGGASGGGAALTAAKVTRPKLSQQIFPGASEVRPLPILESWSHFFSGQFATKMLFLREPFKNYLADFIPLRGGT